MDLKKRIVSKIVLSLGITTAFTLQSGALFADTAKTVVESAVEKVEVSDTIVFKTNLGEIVIKLNVEKAPKSANNFQQYVSSGFYDGTIFHRTIPEFMVQGGGFGADLIKKETQAPVMNEADNGLQNLLGTVAMARTSDPHSATSQFFINVANNGFLDHTAKTGSGWGYAVIGEVIEGMELVTAMSNASTKRAGPHANVPLQTITIEKASFR